MLKMLRVRGRLFHLLSESMPFNKTEYFNALSRLLFVRCTTREYLHLGSEYFGASGICRILLLNPRCCLGDASLVCQSSALTVLPPSFIQLFIIICCYCSIFSQLHYHINYHLSHTSSFPLISHLHQVDNASLLLNYLVNNLNQKGGDSYLKQTPILNGSFCLNFSLTCTFSVSQH